MAAAGSPRGCISGATKPPEKPGAAEAGEAAARRVQHVAGHHRFAGHCVQFKWSAIGIELEFWACLCTPGLSTSSTARHAAHQIQVNPWPVSLALVSQSPLATLQTSELREAEMHAHTDRLAVAHTLLASVALLIVAAAPPAAAARLPSLGLGSVRLPSSANYSELATEAQANAASPPAAAPPSLAPPLKQPATPSPSPGAVLGCMWCCMCGVDW